MLKKEKETGYLNPKRVEEDHVEIDLEHLKSKGVVINDVKYSELWKRVIEYAT
jgi:hypothetical protein